MNNPFDFSNKIRNPDYFFGRKEILRKLYQSINSSCKCSVVGPRRIGKSSLLYQLTLPCWYSTYLDNPEAYVFAFIDLGLLATSDASHFLNIVVKRLCEASQGRLKINTDAYDVAQFTSFLDKARSDKLRLVLCCDEFESLNPNKGFRCEGNFFVFLRSILNDYDITMVTSSQIPLVELCNAGDFPTSPLWNIFMNFPLGLIQKDQARLLISEPFLRNGKSLTEPEINFIYDLAGPHPFFLAMACHDLFELKINQEYPDLSVIEEQFFIRAEEHYEHTWKKLNPEQKNGLKTLLQSNSLPDQIILKQLIGNAIVTNQNQLSSKGWARFIELQNRNHPTVSSFHVTYEDPAFSISIEPEQPIYIHFRGKNEFNDISDSNLKLKVDNFSQRADNVFVLYTDRKNRENWRGESKDIGEELYQQIFTIHSKVFSAYHRALASVPSDDKLHLRFETNRELLRLPIEFLFADDEYLALHHPFARVIRGVHIRKNAPSTKFFDELRSKGAPLRILLIASNTSPNIDGVEQEICGLDASIASFFKEIDISVQLKTIFSEQATFNTVQNELLNCPYHIVHYSGHGSYDKDSPENSPLFFWERSKKQGSIKSLSGAALKLLLQNSEVRFMYLSCCLGTATGARQPNDDFLGISDSLVQAGIPSVLGFRWPVDDYGAPAFALEFYRSLAECRQLDIALLHTRCKIAMDDRNDITWLSPTLIMQDS